MKYALYGLDGDLVTLAEFVRRQSPKPEEWTVQPYCKDCEKRVHAYDIKGALGFREVKQEIFGRKRREPGFDHYDHAASENCPSSYSNDPRYAFLQGFEFDDQARDRNMAILNLPEVRTRNANALRQLMRDLTGMNCYEAERKHLADLAKKRSLYNIEALHDHPWILPFAIVLMVGNHDKIFKDKKYKVCFRPEGSQKLSYTNHKGNGRKHSIPERMTLSFVNEKDGRIWYSPVKNRETQEPVTSYVLSEETIDKVAEMGKRLACTRPAIKEATASQPSGPR